MKLSLLLAREFRFSCTNRVLLLPINVPGCKRKCQGVGWHLRAKLALDNYCHGLGNG